MSSVLNIVYFFAHALHVDKIQFLGLHFEDSKNLFSDFDINFLAQPEWDSLTHSDLADTLVVCHNPSRVANAAVYAETFRALARKARAVLVWDDQFGLISPEQGWGSLDGRNHWAPFGLDLGFSLWDAQLDALSAPTAMKRVRPIVTCFNEADIIGPCVDHLLRQGCEPIIIDNWSNDGTYEKLEAYAQAGAIELERFPRQGPSPVYDWTALLARKEEIALANPGCWILHQDADELRLGAFPTLDLKQNFQIAEAYGCNAVDFCVLNFRPIQPDWNGSQDIETFFRYFEFGSSADDYTRQVKAWISGAERVSLAEQAGHEVRFPNRRVFPYKFLIKHYPLRSAEHARRKLNTERLARISEAERKRGWHSHYNDILRDGRFHWTADALQDFQRSNQSNNTGFLTGFPPDQAGLTPEILRRELSRRPVQVPGRACLVLDLPNDAAESYAIRLGIEELLPDLRSSFAELEVLALGKASEHFARMHGLKHNVLDPLLFVEDPNAPTARATAAAHYLKNQSYDYVLAPERFGILSKTAVLKSQGLEFRRTSLISILVGGTQAAQRDRGLDLMSALDFEIDLLESEAVFRADECMTIAPRAAAYWKKRGLEPQRMRLVHAPSLERASLKQPVTEPKILLVYGIQSGPDVEDLAANLPQLIRKHPKITVIVSGPFQEIRGEHSGSFFVALSRRIGRPIYLAGDWPLDFFLQRLAAEEVIFLSPRCGGGEFAPACRAAAAGMLTVVVSADGEDMPITDAPLVAIPDQHSGAISNMLDWKPTSRSGASSANPVLSPKDCSALELWLSGLVGRHASRLSDEANRDIQTTSPLISVIIPHFERGHLLAECVETWLAQDYPNIELIVVDDGSHTPSNLEFLDTLQPVIESRGGKLIRQTNSYLGAARNRGAQEARGEYLLFFDDDDVPTPTMLHRMLRVAQERSADIVSGGVYFWHEQEEERTKAPPRCSSTFPGDRIELAQWRNPFGSAAILIRAAVFREIGGYTTHFGLGWEDYELSVRASLKGLRHETIPEALYFYRINVHGMASTTPVLANGARVWDSFRQVIGQSAAENLLHAAFLERLVAEQRVAAQGRGGHSADLRNALVQGPLNEPSTFENLIALARMEGQEGIASTLWKAWHGDETWITSLDETDSPPAEPVASLAPMAYLRGLRAVERLGGRETAQSLLRSRSVSGLSDAVRKRIEIRMHLEHDDLNEALRQVDELATESGSDLELLFARLLIAEKAIRAEEGKATREAFKAALAARMASNMPSSWSSADGRFPIDPLEFWSIYPEILDCDFQIFPDILAIYARSRYGSWQALSVQKITSSSSNPQFVTTYDANRFLLHPGEVSQIPTLLWLELDQPITPKELCLKMHMLEPHGQPVSLFVGLYDGVADFPSHQAGDAGQRWLPFERDALTFATFIGKPGESDWSRFNCAVEGRAAKRLLLGIRMADERSSNHYTTTEISGLRFKA